MFLFILSDVYSVAVNIFDLIYEVRNLVF